MGHRWIRKTFGVREFLVGFVVLVLLIGAGNVGLAIATEYSWEERDWNLDGRTTVGEYMAALDITHRFIRVDGERCREYLYIEDDRPVKTVCPGGGAWVGGAEEERPGGAGRSSAPAERRGG